MADSIGHRSLINYKKFYLDGVSRQRNVKKVKIHWYIIERNIAKHEKVLMTVV